MKTLRTHENIGYLGVVTVPDFLGDEIDLLGVEGEDVPLCDEHGSPKYTKILICYAPFAIDEH